MESCESVVGEGGGGRVDLYGAQVGGETVWSARFIEIGKSGARTLRRTRTYAAWCLQTEITQAAGAYMMTCHHHDDLGLQKLAGFGMRDAQYEMEAERSRTDRSTVNQTGRSGSG